MSIHDHSRFKVISETQHLYEHSLEEFSYSHPALPGNGNVKDSLDYILNVLYPRTLTEVATPADLPTGVDTPNIGDVVPTQGDQRLVVDDGDGKYAMYQFAKWDDDVVAIWHKIADIDFGVNGVVQGLLDQTQYLFARKYGTTDYDQVTELALTGDNAGQHIYGGDVAGQNLVLHANNGDAPGLHTGHVFIDDDFSPLTDLEFNNGEANKRWLNGYFGSLIVGTDSMTITSNAITGLITDTNGVISFDDENLITTGNFDASIITASNSLVVDDTVNQLTISIGSILSTTGAISFGDENLTTTGTLASGQATILSDLVLAVGSITSVSGAISFGDEVLTTTGDLNAAIGTLDRLLIDDLVLDGNSISISTLNTNLNLVANGTGVIDLQSSVTAIKTDIAGVLTVVGSAIVDSMTLDGTAISVVGNILTTPSLISEADGARDIGAGGSKYANLFLGTSINDGTEFITMTELMALNRTIYRDVAKTQPAQDGDMLLYNSASSKFLASTPGGSNNHIATYTDVQLATPINVSADMDDARDAIFQLWEVSTGDLMAVPISVTQTLVSINNTVPLPAGNYKLIGIQV